MIAKISELKQLINKVLTKYGYNSSESSVLSEILLYAQLRGNNQGVVKLIGKGIPKREGSKPPYVVKETLVSALVDGNKTHAMIVMNMLAEIAIEKAKQSGVCFAGNFNTIDSTGALGFYVQKIARSGLIGIAYASSPFMTTAPHSSTEALFCTNPVAYGIPTENDPIILDLTTSAMAYYGLIEAKTANKTVPEGTGYNKYGVETVNPTEIMEGALKTFAGHKGSGLALIGQIFAGALVEADSFNNNSDNAGNLVIAIDPVILTTNERFQKEVSLVVKKIKSAQKAPGIDEILIPGERGNRLTQQRLESGEIEIEDNLYNELKKISMN